MNKSFKVVPCPATAIDYAFKNVALVSNSFTIKHAFISSTMKGTTKSLALKCVPHDDIEDDQIGLINPHRSYLDCPFVTVQDLSTMVLESAGYLGFDVKCMASNASIQIDNSELAMFFKELVAGYNAVSLHAPIIVKFNNVNLKITLDELTLLSNNNVDDSKPYLLSPEALLAFMADKTSGVSITGAQVKLFSGDFDSRALGIGGLHDEFAVLLRRAFVTRMFPASTIKQYGIKHCKGIILYGPPGCGKTLTARKIGQLLNCREPKIVNGPEIFDKYIGEAEKNIRALFTDAEEDYRKNGDNADLHLIIFDEIDSICRSRSGSGDSTGTRDAVVNQLLTKLDGVEELDNVLVIGMTNRLDLLDPAILRPGRFEVHLEIRLPDTAGRREILDIHLDSIKGSGRLSPNVDLDYLAEHTRNFTGAELAALVRTAVANAFTEHVGEVAAAPVIEMRHFIFALSEIQPSYGNEDEIEELLTKDLIEGNNVFDYIDSTCKHILEISKKESDIAAANYAFIGQAGCGTSAAAYYCANKLRELDYDYIRLIDPYFITRAGNDQAKAQIINEAFIEARKVPKAVIILDRVDILCSFSQLGTLSSPIHSAIINNLIRRPSKNHSCVVIITCRDSLGFAQSGVFEECELYSVPKLEITPELRERFNSSLGTDLMEEETELPIKEVVRRRKV